MILNNNYNLPQNSNVQAPAFKGTVGKSVKIYYKLAEFKEVQELKKSCKTNGVSVDANQIKAIKDKWKEKLDLLREEMSKAHKDTVISLRYNLDSFLDYLEHKNLIPNIVIRNSFFDTRVIKDRSLYAHNNILNWLPNDLLQEAKFCDLSVLKHATNPNRPFKPKHPVSGEMREKVEKFAQNIGVLLDRDCQVVHEYEEEAYAKYILGLGRYDELSEDVIKKAYKAVSLKWHPDRNPDKVEEATQMMQVIGNAKKTLYSLLLKK